MALIKKVRKIGNSVCVPIPSAVLELLGYSTSNLNLRYTFRLDEDIAIISFFSSRSSKIGKRKLVKSGKSGCALSLPPDLIEFWKLSLGDQMEILINPDNTRELILNPIYSV